MVPPLSVSSSDPGLAWADVTFIVMVAVPTGRGGGQCPQRAGDHHGRAYKASPNETQYAH